MLDVDLASTGPGVLDNALRHLRPNGCDQEQKGAGMKPATDLDALLHATLAQGASDLHLVPGYAPTVRVHGKLVVLPGKALTPSDTDQLVRALVPYRLRDALGQQKSVDCSVSTTYEGATARFRVGVYLAQGAWCACLRHIPSVIPSLEVLGFPQEVAERLAACRDGLIVVTGVTGSGKTTTLAALLQLIRQRRAVRVLTIEEPIEYLYPPDMGGLVTQREVGRDVDTFADGLRAGLRQDPEVILVGEIRDRETAQLAISAAETGHLVLTTLHTRDAKGALSRLVDIFPADAQDEIRTQLSLSLRAIVCQHLVPALDEHAGRALALEVLPVHGGVQVVIRAGKIEQLESAVQTGKREGAVQLDESLQALVTAGRVTAEAARRFAKEPEAIKGSSRSWS
ncbi:MAG: PilT/PilU family type 4a pilus ATPase [Phycisphaerales bacterium]|nr:PilT/PilU family type 4a pilus ATPase [Phycisphaerales bacterium]